MSSLGLVREEEAVGDEDEESTGGKVFMGMGLERCKGGLYGFIYFLEGRPITDILDRAIYENLPPFGALTLYRVYRYRAAGSSNLDRIGRIHQETWIIKTETRH